MLIGYARVSTVEQNLDLQTDSLEKFGCKKIFYDTVSGSQTDKPELTKALEYMRSGDTLVVWRLDRLGRSLAKLIELINDLQNRGFGFHSIQDAIDTTTPTGKFFFHITGAFAELERNLIRERTLAGLTAARARGKKGGRRKAIDPKTMGIAVTLYNEKKLTVKEMCDRLTIKPRTFYRYLVAGAK